MSIIYRYIKQYLKVKKLAIENYRKIKALLQD